ncbi:hypothetical protein MYXO_00970 [Myxococcaceae bacterium]|jgi:hypothetical protein|nr:hypothetical protein MYXO_00970 [Myxococcaceae bacterium]
MKTRFGKLAVAAGIVLAAGAANAAFEGPGLTADQERKLEQNFRLSVSKLKGPYTENICVCPGGSKRPIRSASGALGTGCERPIFCAAYRAEWGEALAAERVYIGNIFSRDVYEWKTYENKHDVVRGYVLEKFFVDTVPDHKLSQLRSFRGLASSEEVGPATARFFELYLDDPSFDPGRHFLLAYELQKRYFLRADVGQIQQLRSAATRVESMDPRFKLLKDAIHNQVSASLIPRLEAYQAKLPQGTERSEIQGLIDQIRKLTSIDEKVLAPQIAEISDAALRAKIEALVPKPGTDPVAKITALAALMAASREGASSKQVPVADRRRLIDLDVTAAAVLQNEGNRLLEAGTGTTARQSLEILRALTEATWAVGLLNDREREAALASVDALLADPAPKRESFKEGLAKAQRVVEWAQANSLLPFAEVWPAWTFVMPQVAGISDDILRGSPLLLYAGFSTKLDDFAAGGSRPKHDLFGEILEGDVRALNPGLATGKLRVAPKGGSYTREEIVALPETPADLAPAAGILTRGEGNVLSHVQLLARALGIPNVVLSPRAYEILKPHDGQPVFFIATPGGRVILEQASAITAEERTVLEEYTRNQARSGSGAMGGGDGKLHIDKQRIDLGPDAAIPLSKIRRSDSGRISGPKAAFLGELAHHFPDQVARGIVLPFGAYHRHYQNAKVAVPKELASRNLATPGEPLPGFVERTYAEYFGKLIPAGKSERELTAWIAPRLEIMRHSIREAPVAPELAASIAAELGALGLLVPGDEKRTVGVFVRSDTNVEDLDNFNGAGLNLTLFNKKSLAEVADAVKEVWASPFSLRSFSWRQTLIDEPLWVLPSIVILESIPSEKSGVLVTGRISDGSPGAMTIATSEGVGGAVDGTSAETIVWSPEGLEIVTLFKSPYRNELVPGGGTRVAASSGSEYVLSRADIEKLVAAGKKIAATFEPARDPAGRPRPWDIEFGFVGDKLWLFQSRPFIGNDSLKNIPALAALEGERGVASASSTLSLSEVLQ